MSLKPDDTKWMFEDDEWEDTESVENTDSSGNKRPSNRNAPKPLTYEEEERIAIQQEGCGKRIDIVLRYPVDS